jgi:hypothetical protein
MGAASLLKLMSADSRLNVGFDFAGREDEPWQFSQSDTLHSPLLCNRRVVFLIFAQTYGNKAMMEDVTRTVSGWNVLPIKNYQRYQTVHHWLLYHSLHIQYQLVHYVNLMHGSRVSIG